MFELKVTVKPDVEFIRSSSELYPNSELNFVFQFVSMELAQKDMKSMLENGVLINPTQSKIIIYPSHRIIKFEIEHK